MREKLKDFSKTFQTDITMTEVDDIENTFKEGEQMVLHTINYYIEHYTELSELKDTQSGNTLLHYAVKYNYIDAAVKLLENGMNPMEANKSSTTPLALALDKRSDEMAALIIRKIEPTELQTLLLHTTECHCTTGRLIFDLLQLRNKDVLEETWLAIFDSLELPENSDLTHVNVLERNEKDTQMTNRKYDVRFLERDINTSSSDGCCVSRCHTVFQFLAEKGNKELMNHHVLRLLIAHKWNKWARTHFIINFSLYLLSLFSLTFAVAVAGTSDDVKAYDGSLQHARAFFEAVATGFALKSVVQEIAQIWRHGRLYFRQQLNILELVSAVLLILVIPIRYASVQYHWYIFALGYLLWVSKIFKYAVVHSSTGAYAETLRQIFLKDIVPFILLFVIVNLAFAGTFLLVLRGENSLYTHNDTSSLPDIWYVGLRTMVEAQPVVEYTGPEGYRTIGCIVMLIFMAFMIVILVNILIGQISQTYSSIQSDALKSVMVNRAWIIARLERNAMSLQWIPNVFKQKGQKEDYLTGPEPNMQKKHPTMEQMMSEFAELKSYCIKIDLKVETVKLRLNRHNNSEAIDVNNESNATGVNNKLEATSGNNKRGDTDNQYNVTGPQLPPRIQV